MYKTVIVYCFLAIVVTQGCCVKSAGESSNTKTFLTFVKTFIRMVAEAGKELHQSDSVYSYKDKPVQPPKRTLAGFLTGRTHHSSNNNIAKSSEQGHDDAEEDTLLGSLNPRSGSEENNSDQASSTNVGASSVLGYPKNSSVESVLDLLLADLKQAGSETNEPLPEEVDDIGTYAATTPKPTKTLCFEPKELLKLHQMALQRENCEDPDGSLETRKMNTLDSFGRRSLVSTGKWRGRMDRLKALTNFVKEKVPYMTEQFIALKSAVEKSSQKKSESDASKDRNSELLKIVIKALLATLKEKYMTKPYVAEPSVTPKNVPKLIYEPKLIDEPKPIKPLIPYKSSNLPRRLDFPKHKHSEESDEDDLDLYENDENHNTIGMDPHKTDKSDSIDPDYFDELYPEDLYPDYQEEPYSNPSHGHYGYSPINTFSERNHINSVHSQKEMNEDDYLIDPRFSKLKGYVEFRPKKPPTDRKFSEAVKWRPL